MLKRRVSHASHACFAENGVVKVKRVRRKPKPFQRRWFRVSIAGCFIAWTVSLSGYLFFPQEAREHERENPHTHTDLVELAVHHTRGNEGEEEEHGC